MANIGISDIGRKANIEHPYSPEIQQGVDVELMAQSYVCRSIRELY